MEVSFSGGGFPFMFSLVPALIGIVFILVFASIVWNAIRYFQNARSPRESVFAKIVAKRMDIRHHTNHHQSNGVSSPVSSSHTYYYITLQFANGERREFLDVKHVYGLVVEGDTGYAAVKGDWIVDFQRQSDK